MPTWRRLAIAGVVGFMVAVAVWAFRPWTASVALAPVDNKTPQAVFSCGAPFGADRVDPANEAARSGVPHAHRPCTARRDRQALAVADLAVGTIAVAMLAAIRRPDPGSDENVKA